MMLKTWKFRMAVVMTVLSLLVASPGIAAADMHEGGHEKHGPMPIAALGVVFGSVIWIASTPFVALFAPTHMLDSLDALVLTPVRVTIGAGD